MESMRSVYWATGRHLYIRTAVHLLRSQSALSCLWVKCRKPRILLPYTFFSWHATGYSSFPSEPKSKHYFIGWLSLRREGCVVSVVQPPLVLVILAESYLRHRRVRVLQLCVAVYVCYVCMEAARCIPYHCFVHNEIMHTILLQST